MYIYTAGMSQTWCKFWISRIWFATLSSSFIKSVTMRLMQLDIGWLTVNLHQAWWQFAADLLSTSRSKRCEHILMWAWCLQSTLTRDQLETCWLWVAMKMTSRTTVIKWVIIYLGKMSNWLSFVTRSMHLFRVLFVTIIEVPNFIIPE